MVNTSLHSDLYSEDPQQRRQTIQALARQGNLAAVPALQATQQHEPVSSLRDYATRALQHLQRQHAIYHLQAEYLLLRAYQADACGAWADALLYLGEALQHDERLADDPIVQQMLSRITTQPAEAVLPLLRDPAKRDLLIQELARPQAPSQRWALPTTKILSVLVVLSLLGYLLTDAMTQFSNFAADFFTAAAVDYVEPDDHTPYFMVLPDGTPPVEGWSTLVVLPDDSLRADAMLSRFTAVAQSEGIALLVPHVAAYPDMDVAVLWLDNWLQRVQASQPVANRPVLFGYSSGGEVVSRYAARFDDQVAGVVTSGATYLVALPSSVNRLLMYGGDDELLLSNTAGQVSVADLADWDDGLDYVQLEGIGHTVNAQQVEMTIQFVRDVYAQ